MDNEGRADRGEGEKRDAEEGDSGHSWQLRINIEAHCFFFRKYPGHAKMLVHGGNRGCLNIIEESFEYS